MKKNGLLKLSLLGISSGLLIANNLSAADSTKTTSSKITEKKAAKSDSSRDKDDPNDGNLGYHMLTEEELLLELNDEGTKLYNNLDAEGKKLALYVASQRCNGTNACEGLNACRTEKNECAGKGSCKGQSKCAMSDKNLAVKLVSQKMAKKRAGLNNQKTPLPNSKSR